MSASLGYVAEGSNNGAPRCVILLNGPAQVAERFQGLVAPSEQREHFIAFYLNSRNAEIGAHIVSVGTLNCSLVHPREVFAPALEARAASLILAHNHPSGDPTPSEEDAAITARLHEAGRLLGIELLDHMVVTRDGFVSLREKRIGGLR